MRGVFQDLMGQRFGKLTVVGRAKIPERQGWSWTCVCDCGKPVKKPIVTNSLITNRTQSCGCLMIERVKEANSTHNKTKTATYVVWKNMWARCTKPNHKSYERYKEFTPCKRWRKFENFLIDMGEKPEGMTLDRINNKKGYSPKNCRWADAFVQQGNTKRNIYVVVNGEKMCLKAACRKLDVPYGRAKRRVHNGWSPEDALLIPKTNRWRSFVVKQQ
jgi:hypothetical protein